MKPDDRFDVSDVVEARQLGDELVLLDLKEATYFGLNEIGARIWQELEKGSTLTEICDAVLSEFDAEQQTVEADVRSLLSELLAASLIAQAVEDKGAGL